jgi:hypothetical protein
MEKNTSPYHKELPDQASFEEFQKAFAPLLSPSKKEAMRVLFPGRRHRREPAESAM